MLENEDLEPPTEPTGPEDSAPRAGAGVARRELAQLLDLVAVAEGEQDRARTVHFRRVAVIGGGIGILLLCLLLVRALSEMGVGEIPIVGIGVAMMLVVFAAFIEFLRLSRQYKSHLRVAAELGETLREAEIPRWYGLRQRSIPVPTFDRVCLYIRFKTEDELEPMLARRRLGGDGTGRQSQGEGHPAYGSFEHVTHRLLRRLS